MAERIDLSASHLSQIEQGKNEGAKCLTGGERAAVRISLQESGCTGYKYVVEEVDAGADSDVKIELENGVRLFLDTGAVAILRGTEIDYAREGINYNLKFRNPNVLTKLHACIAGFHFADCKEISRSPKGVVQGPRFKLRFSFADNRFLFNHS